MDVIVYFDGSCRHDPGRGRRITQGGWAVVLLGTPPTFAYGITPPQVRNPSSTKAEWRALVDALQWLRHVPGIREVTIYGDAAAVIDRLASGVAGGEGHAATCLDILAKTAASFRARRIPREQNQIADKLSRAAAGDLPAWPAVATAARAEREHVVRIVAEHLWRAAGCPWGNDLHFWLAAEDLFTHARGGS